MKPLYSTVGRGRAVRTGKGSGLIPGQGHVSPGDGGASGDRGACALGDAEW